MRGHLGFWAALAMATACTAQSGLVPINDLGANSYQGSQGGLYPGGTNVRPSAHELLGFKQSLSVIPRDSAGIPSSNGKIGLLTIGMSNTNQESAACQTLISQDQAVNPKLVFVNGAQGGQTASIIADENGAGAQYWANVDSKLSAAGLSRQQVQAIWLKEADAGPTSGWPAYANQLKNEMVTISQILRRRFVNARLCYVSSRIYGGYATTSHNPEPYAYHSGFSVKWLIQDQINHSPSLNCGGISGRTLNSPWLSWGPYLWADGTTPRSDGLTWLPSDFGSDGTHPSTQGAMKVAQMLMSFFKTDRTTKGWFLKP